MRTVIIENQMDIKIARHLRIDLVQELAKLLGAMTPMQLANHLASFGIQGSKERSGVPLRV